MKLAYGVTADVRVDGFLGLQGDVEESFSLLANIGYDGVELYPHRLEDGLADRVLSVAERTGLHVPVIGTALIPRLDGLFLLSEQRSIGSAALDRVKEFIDFARVLGADITLGKVRGSRPSSTHTDWAAELERILGELCAYGGSEVKILLEAQHPSVVDTLSTSGEILNVINRLSLDNLYVHLDTAHLDRTEADAAQSILACGDRLGYIHLADRNRMVPGEGGIPFAPLCDALKSIRYDGWVSLEIEQGEDPGKTAKRAYEASIRLCTGGE